MHEPYVFAQLDRLLTIIAEAEQAARAATISAKSVTAIQPLVRAYRLLAATERKLRIDSSPLRLRCCGLYPVTAEPLRLGPIAGPCAGTTILNAAMWLLRVPPKVERAAQDYWMRLEDFGHGPLRRPSDPKHLTPEEILREEMAVAVKADWPRIIRPQWKGIPALDVAGLRVHLDRESRNLHPLVSASRVCDSLSPLQRDALIALLHQKAVDAKSKITGARLSFLATGGTRTDGTWQSAMSNLHKRTLVECPGKGYFLTKLGIDVAVVAQQRS